MERKPFLVYNVSTIFVAYCSIWPGSPQVSCSSLWLEHLTGVLRVSDSIPVGDSDYFLCPTLMT